MYTFYFSLLLFSTFSFFLVSCYFNWENNYTKFALEILKDAKINFAFNSYMSKHSFEMKIFEKCKLNPNLSLNYNSVYFFCLNG